MSTSSPPDQAGDRTPDRADGHGAAAPVPIKEAADRLGVSVATLRRWIREGRLHTERISRPQGYTVLVHLPPHGQVIEQVSTEDHVRDDDHVGEQVPLARDVMRAEAMAVYTRSMLEPLIARLADQEGTIRDQAETIGRLTERVRMLEAPRPDSESAPPAEQSFNRLNTRRLVPIARALAALALVLLAAAAWVR